jgi:hypothetical protein
MPELGWRRAEDSVAYQAGMLGVCNGRMRMYKKGTGGLKKRSSPQVTMSNIEDSSGDGGGM